MNYIGLKTQTLGEDFASFQSSTSFNIPAVAIVTFNHSIKPSQTWH